MTTLLLLLRTTSPGAYGAEVELAMSMSAQEIIRDLRAGGEQVDVTLAKVGACSRVSRRLLMEAFWPDPSIVWQLVLSPAHAHALQSMGNMCGE